MGLTIADMEHMTVGNCLDYVDHVIEIQEPSKKRKRQATQSDFDNF